MIVKCLTLLLFLLIGGIRSENDIISAIKRVSKNLFSDHNEPPVNIYKLNFTKVDDFKNRKIHEILLEPGNALFISCNGFINGSKVKLYPPNPDYETLNPLEDNFITYEKLSITKHLREVIKSSTPLIDATKVHNGMVKIVYTHDNIIATRDSNSSINIACSVKQLGDNNSDQFNIQWVNIKFNKTIPFSYGCGSDVGDLFLTNPDRFTSDDRYTYCNIQVSPGMLIGFYCGKEGKMHHPDCLSQSNSDDKSFKFEEVVTSLGDNRIKMIKIISVNNTKNSRLVCQCRVNESIVSRIHIVNKPIKRIGSVNGLPNKRMLTYFRNISFIRPGENMQLDFPRNGTVVTAINKKYITEIIPKETSLSTMVMVYKDKLGVLELANIQDILGTVSSNGFDVNSKGLEIKEANSKYYTSVNINYPEDAIVVFKDVVASITIVLDLESEDKYIHKTSNSYVTIMATDPYTYGCGVEHVNSSGIFKNDKYMLTDVEDGVVGCKVDARRAKLVGFFCPKPARYDPPNCFEQVYLMKDMRNLTKENLNDNNLTSKRLFTNTKIHLTDATTEGESFNGKFIRAARFNNKYHSRVDDGNDYDDFYNDNHDYTNDKLGAANAVGCKCVDEKGKIIAQILLFVPSDKPNHVSWTYNGVLS